MNNLINRSWLDNDRLPEKSMILVKIGKEKKSEYLNHKMTHLLNNY